ncbi:N4-gp56 family major capsid protein [Veillonella sp. KGMB01456]|uniref:N4-gp56 family major capsid protein n=1 Tax=Veillonella sp. KGMB01456 TaxID=2934794 RepID=UPI001FF399D6|nr:N4-gp56 family major capsid protein [Veillonella sp. KGMB01456]MCK0529584.1 N4-gp56 family major capsid protein [Veillonella sp. KGMB01456]DAH82817.1 MAG TPA: major capsid protein [Caudoviricetes sp.]
MADMANQLTIPANLVPKLWARKVWHEGVQDSYFEKFTSTDGKNVVHKNADLKKVKGDKVTFGLAMNLAGDGVVGTRATLKGKEDQLSIHDFSVTVDLIRNAVTRYEAEDQKSPYDNLPLIKSALTQWLSDYLDNTLMAKLSASPTTGEVMYAATAGTVEGTAATDKLTCSLISAARRKAKMHAPKVNPIKIDGQDKYIMLVSPWAARDLKEDTAWQAAQQNANVRGAKNPIFSGSLGEYDGVVLYEYERVVTSDTGASGATINRNLLLGTQAACFGVASEPRHIAQDDDYGNVQGNGISIMAGIEKSKYNSKDYGVIQVITGGKKD